MKKCIITGHSSGVGRALYEHFQSKGWKVIGMSRSNGYNILLDQDKIINEADGCDLFINNATEGRAQLELLQKLCNRIPRIVTMGSAGTNFSEIWNKQYNIDKTELEEISWLISLSPNVAKTLLIKLSFAELTYSREKTNRIGSDCVVSYREITNVIEFWLDNPKIRQLDFEVKLTTQTLQEVKQVTGDELAINRLCEKVKHAMGSNL